MVLTRSRALVLIAAILSISILNVVLFGVPRRPVAVSREVGLDFHPGLRVLCNRPTSVVCQFHKRDVCNVDERSCACACDLQSTYCAASGTPGFDAATVGTLVVPLFRINSTLHYAVVGGRVRHSGATDVQFLGPSHFVAMSFAASELYLFGFDLSAGTSTLLDTVGNAGDKGDLIDWDGNKRLLVSNLFSGSQNEFRVDLSAGSLRRTAHYKAHGPGVGGKCHSAAFVPRQPDLIVATNSKRNKRVDFDTVVYNTTSNEIKLKIKHGRVWYPQDVAFMGDDSRYMFIVFTTTKIQSSKRLKDNQAFKKSKRCLANELTQKDRFNSHFMVKLYRLNIAASATSEAHELQTAFIPGAHPDSMVWRDGLLFVQDQLNDVVHVLTTAFHTLSSASPEGEGYLTMSPLPRLSPIRGFHMPHGVDVAHGMLAVSSYGDASVKIMKLPSGIVAEMGRLRELMSRWGSRIVRDPSMIEPRLPVEGCSFVGRPCRRG